MYELELTIDGNKKKFVRNEEPVLHDMIQALKVQYVQTRMLNRQDGETSQDANDNEKAIADFAVSFWNGQFKVGDVKQGCNLKNLDVINTAIRDSLGAEEDSEEENTKEDSEKN